MLLWYFLYSIDGIMAIKAKKIYTRSSDKIRTSHTGLIGNVPYDLNWEENMYYIIPALSSAASSISWLVDK